MLMMRPLPRARMCGRTALVMRMTPKTLTSKTRWSWATELSSAAPAEPTPALLTRTSILPNRSITCPTTAWTDAPLATSRSRNPTPSAGVTFAAFRLVPTTSKPASASARAAALPIPEDAPVTRATGRFVVIMNSSVHWITFDCLTFVIPYTEKRWMASVLIEERIPVRYGKRKRPKRAAGRASSRQPPAGSSKTVSTARGSPRSRRRRDLPEGTAPPAGLPSGRSDGRNGLRPYYNCWRVSADGKWFLRRVEERVARYGEEHKQATRRRIIETAGRRLKRDGIDGSGVATLMADAGLTNGAFYAHFASKDDLVAAAVAGQLREQRESLSAVTPGRAGVEQYVRAYLSVQHRDNPGDGCPSAALLDEIGRCTDATKRAYTDGLLAVIDDVAARLAPHDPPSARAQTLSVFALMAGTLQLSRALADRQLADEVLEQGIQNALALLDAEQQR